MKYKTILACTAMTLASVFYAEKAATTKPGRSLPVEMRVKILAESENRGAMAKTDKVWRHALFQLYRQTYTYRYAYIYGPERLGDTDIDTEAGRRKLIAEFSVGSFDSNESDLKAGAQSRIKPSQ